MKYAEFLKLSPEQKRAAFAEWYMIADRIAMLRREIDAGRNAIAAYFASQRHRYDPLHAERRSLRADQIPPKAPPVPPRVMDDDICDICGLDSAQCGCWCDGCDELVANCRCEH